MDDRQSAGGRRAGYDPRAIGVDGEGTLALALGAIDGGVGGAVDDGRQSRHRKGARDARRIANVALLLVQSPRCTAIPINSTDSRTRSRAVDVPAAYTLATQMRLLMTNLSRSKAMTDRLRR